MRSSILLSLMIFGMTAMAAPETTATAPVEAQPEADFDSLGGNTILLERARALEPEKKVSIVQERTVNRRMRLEIAPEISTTFSGETYSRTKSLGLNFHYHITPRFSLGAKYNYSFNSLTSEGEALVNEAERDAAANPGNPSAPFPKLDWANQEYMGLVNWYPIYGKLNFFDSQVVHFDVYALGGYGQVQLNSGSTGTYTAGGGVGLWMNQHFTTRLEMRYQRYTVQYFSGKQDLDLTVGSLQMGWML